MPVGWSSCGHNLSARFIIVVSLLIENQGEFLLLKRCADKDHAPGEWEGVSGSVEHGESPAVAALREAREETGLIVEILQLLDTFHFYRGIGKEEAIGISYLCCSIDRQVTLSVEHDAFAWVSSAEAAKFAVNEGLLKCISAAGTVSHSN